jgi:hypothetical protein
MVPKIFWVCFSGQGPREDKLSDAKVLILMGDWCSIKDTVAKLQETTGAVKIA